MKRTRALLGSLVGGCWLGCGPNVDPGAEGEPCDEYDDCVSGVCEDGRCSLPPGSGSESDDETSNDATTGSDDVDDVDETVGEGTDGGCVVNSDCPLDARCGDDGLCIGLLSEECTSVLWPSSGARDGMVFVGSILPSSAPTETLVPPYHAAVQLAFEDFDENTALQGDREIAWVACDDSEGTDAAISAAQHLVERVGVPAIVGPIRGTEDVANQVTIPAGVLLMNPAGSAEQVLALPDDDLVWATGADDVFQTHAMAELLLEEEPARLLILGQDTPAMNEMVANTVGLIEALLPPDRLVTLLYADPASFFNEDQMWASYGQTLAGALGQLPDPYVALEDHYTHVVVLGDTEAQSVLWLYLTQWALLQNPDQPSPPMPRFYFMAGAASVLDRAVNDIDNDPVTELFAEYQAEVLERLQGVSSVVTDPENFEAFAIRYAIRFNEQNAMPITALAYDAMMAVQLAMATVPIEEEVTGAALAAAIPRLDDPDGTFVSFEGTTLGFIEAARNALVVPGGSVDLQGVSGSLDWDDRGGVRADVEQSGLENVGSPESPEALVESLRLYRLDPAPAVDGEWDPL